MSPLTISSRVVIPVAELTWSAVRASGPGGQNVNKVSSKVVLVFDLERSQSLSNAEKTRLVAIAGNAVDNAGAIHITSQKTRDQNRNLEDAREKLADMIRRALVVPVPRRKTKPTRGSQRRRLDEKRKDSDKKKERQRRDD
jgi:ribosome-associated protein